jgi:hypothetical protein
MRSLPASPNTWSLPVPPVSTSLPAPPNSRADLGLSRKSGDQAEDCVELANEATERYAKTALLELAAEFRESAERLEHRMQELRFPLKGSFSFDC